MKTYKLSDIAPFLRRGDEIRFLDRCWTTWHRALHDYLIALQHGEMEVLYRSAVSTSEEGELCEAYEESLREKTEEPFDPKDLSKLKKGDVIKQYRYRSIILARLEDLVFLSSTWTSDDDAQTRGNSKEKTFHTYHFRELEHDDWTIYREPDHTETIEIDGKKYLKADIDKLNPINQ